jgi:hypothetical protein
MRDTGTLSSPGRTRSFPVASAVLAIVMMVAYVRTRQASSKQSGFGRSGWGRAGRRGALRQPSGPRPVPDFIEVGPDQYKQASAASEAEVQVAMNRLLGQAAVQAEEAADNAGTAGAYSSLTTADPELLARADALKAEAEALQHYLEHRQRRS